MTSTPTSFRLPPNLNGKAEPEVVQAFIDHDYAINDLQQAIPSLKSQIDALSPSTAAASSNTENVTNISETIISGGSEVGFVNNQTGVTAYQTQQSDSGSLIVLNDASAIAVTLSVLASVPGIQLPWTSTILNLGAGTATLTPATGTISYAGNIAAASMPVASGVKVSIWFDGTNFYAG